MAGPLSSAIKGAGKVARKAVTKTAEMHPLDNLLAQIPDPNKVTQAQLRKLEQMMPKLNAAQRKRAGEFLGLSDGARFPNREVLGRAGITPGFSQVDDGMSAELNRRAIDMAPRLNPTAGPNPIAGHFPQPKPMTDDMKTFMTQMNPAGNSAADAFASQVAPGLKPQRTGRMSAMLGALNRNKGKAALGAGAGLGAAALMSGGEDSDVDSTLDALEQSGLAPMPSHGSAAPVSSPPVRRGGMSRPKPKASGLSGVNGMGDITELLGNFGAPDVDFEAMVADDVNRPIPQVAPEQKKSGGMGNFLKTMGPLLAALYFGRMLK